MSRANRDSHRTFTFRIDDRVIDDFAPVLSRYPGGTAALAVYIALARRADHNGESWPGLNTLAEQAAISPRSVQRAIQLLELLGLVAVTTCYEEGSKRQTSNHYTLLTPPASPPEQDPDPATWPTPSRRTRLVRSGQRAQPATDAPQMPPTPTPAGPQPPCQGDTPSPVSVSPRPRHADTPPPATVSPLEGNTREVFSVKDGDTSGFAAAQSFTISEIGLSNRQVWAATLAELARGGAVSVTDLEAWLRPAALIGREGDALLLGAPSTAARDRISARLLPPVRAALAQVVGVALPVSVVTVNAPPAALPRAPARPRRASA